MVIGTLKGHNNVSYQVCLYILLWLVRNVLFDWSGSLKLDRDRKFLNADITSAYIFDCHFETRQRPEAPECWRHFSVSGWPEICRARTKACKQVWTKNYSRTKWDYLVKIASWMTYNDISLSQKEPCKRKMIQNGS